MGLISQEHVGQESPVMDEVIGQDAAPVAASSIAQIQPGWSQWRECRSAAVKVVVLALTTTVLTWAFAGWHTIHIAGWICLTGVLLVCLQSYPVLISRSDKAELDTPENAIRTFFQSLEHHGPMFRRMWLLLTPTGQTCRGFSDYDSFRLYWRRRLREWRHRSGAWPLTPAVVEVQIIECELEDEGNSARLHYEITIKFRGRRHLSPVAQYGLESTAQRASDGHWYLNQGALPE